MLQLGNGDVSIKETDCPIYVMTSSLNTPGLHFLDSIYLSWNAPMYHLQIEHTKKTTQPVMPCQESNPEALHKEENRVLTV